MYLINYRNRRLNIPSLSNESFNVRNKIVINIKKIKNNLSKKLKIVHKRKKKQNEVYTRPTIRKQRTWYVFEALSSTVISC